MRDSTIHSPLENNYEKIITLHFDNFNKTIPLDSTMAFVLASNGFVCTNPFVRVFTPLIPRRKTEIKKSGTIGVEFYCT